ncbi:MAG: hypothetical protein OXF84_11975 [Bacteroidetes bacterium]|nr:hypothetical protein [Bacteroidota bacterium]
MLWSGPSLHPSISSMGAGGLRMASEGSPESALCGYGQTPLPQLGTVKGRLVDLQGCLLIAHLSDAFLRVTT